MKARIEKKSEDFKPYNLIINIETPRDAKALLYVLKDVEDIYIKAGVDKTNIFLETSRYLQDVINLKITK
jgi:hypothetical protein